ncbi:MAG: c-type cytochrome, partial [Flavobacteriales bacterium]|nr:c-type cytochrome [Flavobacteriales bacterium]
SYVEAAQEVFGREPDAYVITRAIATFERTLVSGNSAYDLYLQSGYGLSEEAINGKDLFESERTNCSGCHSGFNFTNYTFENNGLYETYEDVGRFRLTIDTNDIARFKVPSLRNIELTGPYMHDGSISTLREVLDHYNQGGTSHPHKSELIKPLNLSNQEIEDLESFLRSLTDKKFTNNPLFYENDNQTD